MQTEQYRTSQVQQNSGPGGRNVSGRTRIADVVVESIAGIAAREADGVYSMGGGVSRAMGAMRDRLQSGEDSTRGVDAEVGETQAAIDIALVVEYGAIITDTAHQIRSNVWRTVKEMTGLEVVEINIDVRDVHVPEPSEESGDAQGAEGSGGSRRDRRSASVSGDRSHVR